MSRRAPSTPILPFTFKVDSLIISQVLTALLENGFTADNLGQEQVNDMLEIIHGKLQDGVTGASEDTPSNTAHSNLGLISCSAHIWFPDADDTSRALTALNLHGYQLNPASMAEKFEVDHCFQTFDARMPNRVESVSVNGNVLNSLLHSPDPSAFTSQIEKVATYMCGRWNPDGKFQDHWVSHN